MWRVVSKVQRVSISRIVRSCGVRSLRVGRRGGLGRWSGILMHDEDEHARAGMRIREEALGARWTVSYRSESGGRRR